MRHCGMLVLGLVAMAWSESAAYGADEPTAKKSAANALDDALKSEPLTFETDIRPLLKKFCYECHGDQKQKAGLNLEQAKNEQSILEGRKIWERAAGMIRSREMPPQKRKPQPTQEERDLLHQWITDTTSKIDCTGTPDPGRVTIRRLNRFEYNNTIRDLIGVDFKPAADFPSDDVGYGFDNIGDVLSLPTILFEKYLTAAEKITQAAIVAEPLQGTIQTFVGDKLSGGQQIEDGAQLLTSSGKISATVELPAAGKYLLRIRAFEMHAGPAFAKLGLLLDGQQQQAVDVQGQSNSPQTFSLRLDLTAGKHVFAGEFLNDYYKPDDPDPNNRDRNLAIVAIELQGPLDEPASVPLTDSHRRIFTRTPKPDLSDVEDCAQAILGSFARRAFRRPLEPDELERLTGLSRNVMLEGESFERAIEVGVQAILVSPHFLFRVEIDAEPENPRAIHSISDFELASRLSYFLWSSMPDEELLQLASRNGLRTNGTLRLQVERMLLDPKAQSFMESFSGQWLQTRNLKQMTPDPKLFPSFDEPLREAMRQETELFFGEIVRGNHSILDLLDADFTFVNERLAKHYGLSGVSGEKFQRVRLDGTQRAGILTQASILTLTSNPTRTSPVKRGKWMLENILGTPPPPPPPNVEELKTDEKSVLSGSLRQRMEQHRANPSCASCHKSMDPLGFGFENFDAIGAWRITDGNFPIDPAGVLPSGLSFSSPRELRVILKSSQAQFARCLTEKMLTYALGRGLEYYDKCAIDSLTESLAKDNYRIGTLIQAIVHSEPFQKRRGKQD